MGISEPQRRCWSVAVVALVLGATAVAFLPPSRIAPSFTQVFVVVSAQQEPWRLECRGAECDSMVYVCPPDHRVCEYRCIDFASCDHSSFGCEANQNCTLSCEGTASCASVAFGWVSSGAAMTVHCAGISACHYSTPFVKPNASIEILIYQPGNAAFVRTNWCNDTSMCTPKCAPGYRCNQTVSGNEAAVGTTGLVVMGLRNRYIKADNTFFTPGGDILVLMLGGVPNRDDNFLANLTIGLNLLEGLRDGALALNQSQSSLYNLSDSVVALDNKLLRVTPNPFWWNAQVFSGVSGYEDVALRPFGLQLLPNISFDVPNKKLVLYLGVMEPLRSLLVNNSAMQATFLDLVKKNGRDFMESFFHLPDICLTVSPAFFGDGLIHLIVDFPQDDNCQKPGPFFGVCCKNGSWHGGSSDKMLWFPEYVITRSPVFLDASFTMLNAPILLSGSTFEARSSNFSGSSLQINSSGLVFKDFTMANSTLLSSNSTISIGDPSASLKTTSLSFSSTTTLDLSNSNISVIGCANLSGHLKLGNDSISKLSQGEAVQLMQSDCLVGAFDSITDVDSSKAYCLSDTRLNSRLQVFVISCTKDSPNGGQADNTGAIVGGSIVVVLVVAAVLVVFLHPGFRKKVFPFFGRAFFRASTSESGVAYQRR